MRPDFGSADPSRASHDRLRKTDETAVPLRSPNLLCRWLRPRSRLSDELAALGLDSGPRQPPDSQHRTKGDLECGLITIRFRSKVFTMCSAQCVYHVPVLTDTRVDISSPYKSARSPHVVRENKDSTSHGKRGVAHPSIRHLRSAQCRTRPKRARRHSRPAGLCAI